MPSTLTLFEHEAKPFEWTDRDLVLLEKMRAAAGAEILRPTIRGRTRTLQAAQHVGVVRLGNRTVQVLPKIYFSAAQPTQAEGSFAVEEAPPPSRKVSKDQIQEATANLLRMLAYAGEFSVREHELASLTRQTDDWFEILTRLFATHLREEWQHGAHRTYQTIEDDLSVLKGKLRIGEQLRRPTRQHIFSVTYDQFTSDNHLNRVFRYVVERLWRLTRDHDNRQLLGEMRQWMEEVTLLPRVTSASADPSQLTRLNERYRPLLNLARIFLDGGALQLAAGDLSTFAFVFDMNQLFENFIASFIRKHSAEILTDELRVCDFLLQSRGASRHLARREETSVFLTRPDIAFRDAAKQFPLLLDTKYKRLDKADRKLGVSQSDFYQMHAYAHRYDCRRIILLYPQMAEAGGPLKACFKLEDCQKIVDAASVNLCIDLSSRQSRQQLIFELRAVFAGE